jgi:PAS domain S-box-containing protein
LDLRPPPPAEYDQPVADEELHALNRALLEASEFQTALVESVPHLVIATDLTGRVLVFNAAAAEHLRYERGEVVGKKMLTDFVDWSDALAIMEAALREFPNAPRDPMALLSVVLNARRSEREWTLVRSDGTAFPALLGLSLLRSYTGAVTGFLAVGTDITDRKRRELQLVRSERRAREAQESAQVGTWEADGRGRIEYWSPALYRLFGRDESLGLPSHEELLSCLHPEDRAATRRTAARAMRQGGSHEHAFRVIRPDGMVRSLLSRGSAVRTAGGDVVRWRGLVLDVTERRQAEEELATSERRLREAERVAGCGSWNYDHDPRQTYWSEQMFALFGRDHHLGAPDVEGFLGYVHPEDRARVRDTLRQQDGARHELSFRTSEEPARVLQLRCESVSDRHGRPRGTRGTCMDVTAHVRHEQQLAAARDEAYAATKSKSAFFAAMSHEIRTPLHGLLGMLELLRTTDLGAEQASLLDTAASAGQTLVTVIDDVLEFSKGEAGRLELSVAPFRPALVIADCIRLFADRARTNDVQIFSDVSSNVPAWVLGDPMRFGQVLSNLLSNAVKFTTHGEVWVRLRPESDSMLRVSVTDTGIGLTAEQRSRLFSPFTQADAETNRRFGGTGLGLYICRHLVTLMHGEIGVSSECLGGGSTFWFTAKLPETAAPTGAARLPDAAKPARPATALRVLVADDNPVNRRIAERMLGRLGHTSVSVDDGAQAVAAVASERFDVVLMDCHMPVMDGFAATRAIRATHATVRILAMTASAFAEDRDAASAAGMDGFLAKPFRLDELVAALHDAHGA